MGEAEHVNFAALTIDQVRENLDRIAADAGSTFGSLSARQLNWRPDAVRWSVAQCLEHLVQTNRAMCLAFHRAADPGRPRTRWQRLPVVPRVFGRLLISSQAPTAKRKFTAVPAVSPPSDVDPGVIERFIAAQRDVSGLTVSLGDRDLETTIMVSPFVSWITYSVLDGLRLVVAHDLRHLQQAKHVTDSAGFPA